MSVVEQNNLWVTDLETLRNHYATTLVHWEKRFQENRAQVEEMFDEKFARMWEFYLISAEMMFRTGAQMVFHIQLSRNRDVQRRWFVIIRLMFNGNMKHGKQNYCRRFD